ncbi:hypothetical protein GXM_02330 [Nostoc sphaeroides CCNUC1]|uniref:Uncharacterized protein n=1 Tax=Nostoc sphaeroides CCNUC1 TaxID=2653204 RepID=A0A5P8VWR2_9NOSO|nr:hypothetical protein GXM_02330 [Nostoc sphaeroides CCNUC1]
MQLSKTQQKFTARFQETFAGLYLHLIALTFHSYLENLTSISLS